MTAPALPALALTSTSRRVRGLACQFTPGSRRGNSLWEKRQHRLRQRQASGTCQLGSFSGLTTQLQDGPARPTHALGSGFQVNEAKGQAG